ncbi:MAG: flagellar basal body rod C-terminal domain-containing protein [Pseudomonadota bacterium]
MNFLKATMQNAISGMDLQAKRIDLTSENISNADTPGYQRKLLIPKVSDASGSRFQETLVALDPTPGETEFDPTHPLADTKGYVTNSNVTLVVEMADMRDANRLYEANLNTFQQAKNMYRSLLDALRR